MHNSFFFTINKIPLFGWTTVYLSFHLLKKMASFFQVLTVMNKVALAAGYCVDINFQLLWEPNCRIVWQEYVQFSEKQPHFFKVVIRVCIPSRNEWKVPVAPHPQQHLVMLVWILAIPLGVLVVSHCCLNWHFLDDILCGVSFVRLSGLF